MGKPIVVFGSFVVDLTGWAEDPSVAGTDNSRQKIQDGSRRKRVESGSRGIQSRSGM